MKGFTEFKGYRTRITYDPDSGEFVARSLGYPDFEIKVTKVSTETQVKPTGRTTTEHEVQLVELETQSERSAKPRKSRTCAPTHSSATMES